MNVRCQNPKCKKTRVLDDGSQRRCWWCGTAFPVMRIIRPYSAIVAWAGRERLIAEFDRDANAKASAEFEKLVDAAVERRLAEVAPQPDRFKRYPEALPPVKSEIEAYTQAEVAPGQQEDDKIAEIVKSLPKEFQCYTRRLLDGTFVVHSITADKFQYGIKPSPDLNGWECSRYVRKALEAFVQKHTDAIATDIRYLWSQTKGLLPPAPKFELRSYGNNLIWVHSAVRPEFSWYEHKGHFAEKCVTSDQWAKDVMACWAKQHTAHDKFAQLLKELPLAHGFYGEPVGDDQIQLRSTVDQEFRVTFGTSYLNELQSVDDAAEKVLCAWKAHRIKAAAEKMGTDPDDPLLV